MSLAARVLVFSVLLAARAAGAEHLAGSERIELAPAGGGDKITGFLFLPAGASAQSKVPGVVVVHGSGGVRNAREGQWGRDLVAEGIAVLAIDSFTPRGISSTVEDQSRITTTQMVRDAFGALAVLAQQPTVDGKRVAVMGMSRGGTVALMAADARNVPDAGLRFAAHIPLYPGCLTRYRHPRMAAPILMLIGANDDYTGVKPCAEYAERIRAAGGKVELKTYEGAHHGFDSPGLRTFWIARAQNFRDCTIYVEDDGRAMLEGTGETVSLEDVGAAIAVMRRSCMRMGATVGHHAEARRRALEDVKSFIKAHLSQ